jgi:hypothetical protein
LPNGWSYPLKRGVLDAALKAAGVTGIFSVRYSYGGGRQQHRPLRVQFDGEDVAAGKVSIAIFAVPAGERWSTMTQLESRLATVCEWIRNAEVAAPTWRMARHSLEVELRDGQVLVLESQ